MADQVFENPKLAAIYDVFDGDRDDLEHYLEIAKELQVKTILDIGCGTGSFAKILIENEFKVIGLEPAEASLAIAREKVISSEVKWLHGDAKSLVGVQADLAVMTGNVAQVFLSDKEWGDTLISVCKSLSSGGHLVFESRIPEQKDWVNWNKEKTYTCIDVEGVGPVEAWCDLGRVEGELVSFQWTYIFKSENSTVRSNSTIRFRSKEDLLSSLVSSGFKVIDVRGAPDRPGKEFVFVARKES